MEKRGLFQIVQEQAQNRVLYKKEVFRILRKIDGIGKKTEREVFELYAQVKAVLGFKEMKGLNNDYLINNYNLSKIKEKEKQDIQTYNDIYSFLTASIHNYGHEIRNIPDRNILGWIESHIQQYNPDLSQERTEEVGANLFLQLEENGQL